MKTKLEMAHEYAIALINSDCEMQFDKFIRLCWNYADAMQAEADKREHKHMFLNNEPCICGVTMNDVANKPSDINDWHEIRGEEWQPDWSQAPEWANWWVATANQSGKITGGWFYENEPEFGAGKGPSVYYSPSRSSILTDSFGYTGDWRNSLRKRPQ